MLKKGKYLLPICIILVGIFFAVYSLKKYQFYSSTQGPMQGFMPVVLGVLLAISGIAALIQARQEEDKPIDIRNWSIVLAMGLVLIFNFIIGTLPSVAVFLILWLRFVSKYDWKMTMLVTCIMMSFVIGVFWFWMDIPFTQGIVFELLFR